MVNTSAGETMLVLVVLAMERSRGISSGLWLLPSDCSHFQSSWYLHGNTDEMMMGAEFVETSLVNECLGDALSASPQLPSLPGLGSLLLPGF